jgi:glycosyltransferase involved in cell wall biosynthesis
MIVSSRKHQLRELGGGDDDPGVAWCRAKCRGLTRPGAVLFHAPSFAFQAAGGGENQLIQTGRHLEALGIDVRLFSCWSDRLEEARLLHLFGMSYEGLELARIAEARQIPVVLSPICWIEPAAMAALASGRVRGALERAKWALKIAVPRWPCWRRELLDRSCAILPNSQAEGKQLVAYFGADARRIHVIPNGVSPRFAGASPERFGTRFGTEPFVLFVGRIEPRKNVLGLVSTVRALGLPLVAIGVAPPGHEAYEAVCRRAGGSAVRWLGPVAHDDPLLASAYAAARVFALPSWFETPGLAALEAALAGTAVVITPLGCTREYFGDRVEYARPDRPRALRRVLERAWLLGASPELKAEVAARYLWSHVAARTAEVYDKVVH